MVLDKAELKNSILRKLRRQYGKTMEEAHEYEIYYAVSRATLDYVVEKWYNTKKTYVKKHAKQIYYFSAEFLMGRYLGNNLINLQMNEVIRETLSELGVDINKVEDQEIDTGLGNGGLGRLAACFLDSMATLKLPGHGYGLRYKYGMFEQRIENGFQVEYPDNWTKYGDPWSIKRMDRVFEVKFGGKIEVHRDEVGKEYFKRVDTENVLAVAYDVPIIGYGNDTVNTLRLWEARSPEGFDLNLFNSQKYLMASEKAVEAEDISRVLYPNDTEKDGKMLRLKQQFFFTSASLQDIVRRYKSIYGNDFSKFHEKVAIQLNDTHPVVGIPELMRILLDQEKFPKFFKLTGKNETKMHWEWGTGYRFTKIEGKYDNNTEDFSIHTGSTRKNNIETDPFVPGVDAFREVTLSLPSNAVVGTKAPKITIKADFDKLLNGTNKITLLGNIPNVHNTNNMIPIVDNLGGDGKDNKTGMFSVGKVE